MASLNEKRFRCLLVSYKSFESVILLCFPFVMFVDTTQEYHYSYAQQ